MGAECVAATLERTKAVSRCGCVGGRCEAYGVLFYALIFFIVSCVAALVGFNDIAPGIAGIARLVFYAALALALITLVLGIPRR